MSQKASFPHPRSRYAGVCATYRVVRPGLSEIVHPNLPLDSSNLIAAFHHLEVELTNYFAEKKAA